MVLSAMALTSHWRVITANTLVDIIRSGKDKVLLIDSRSFLEYNTCHIVDAVNVCCSKLVKRRLQQNKISVRDLLSKTCAVVPDVETRIIVYDQCTTNPANLSEDCFLMVLLKKLDKISTVSLLKGGFLEFQAAHSTLCESQTTCTTSSGTNYMCPPLTFMSQPCMPVANVGPTKILPFLYLGSQRDALSKETVQQSGINYVLNASTSCPKPIFIPDRHFLRIPVNDNYSDKMLPFFQQAFQFIDKVREANGCVLVHCLAGISRSPTLAIAYVIRYLNMSTDEAYKYVKDKRPTISPNFNFLGQLLEYEQHLRTPTPTSDSSPDSGAVHKKQCLQELGRPSTSQMPVVKPKFVFKFRTPVSTTTAQSPTTALSKLSFSPHSPVAEETPTPTQESEASFPHFPTTSLDRLSFTPCLAREDPNLKTTPPKVSVATKRPLSTCAKSASHTDSAAGSITASVAEVVRRSPESRAKRPLVRPNSIAFSTYPKMDFTSDRSASPARATCTTEPPSKSPGRLFGSAASTPTKQECKKVLQHVRQAVETRHRQAVKDEPGGNCRSSFEQARKSRSLEDILNSAEDEGGACGGGAIGSTYWGHVMNAADLFAPPVGLDTVHSRCRGASDPHQSSSSISSSESHNSLHGSLELIQVS